ncbi:MAG TPA: hypothetical protein PLH70_08530 [Bacteroidales bacterium]|nr:hypothetical protein [Bacteroidales bacterium]HOH22012.1 hypothetical protein [Bacteroidales bacterium]HPZ04153.1 hypothetical protein [Bacteroidales bacterium]HQB75830.1 hypothetical protein [Bacteroidales bacterium]HQQ21491.1 hypothetical protein [Bacteroidales bacterium]
MKKQIFITLILIGITIFSINAQAQSTDKGRLSIINEYGPYFGRNTIGFTAVFVAGYSTPSDKDMFGLGVGYDVGVELTDGIPLFVNYRHSFHPDRAVSPIVNMAAGVRLNLSDPVNYSGIYATMASGFQVGMFSLTGGLFLKSLGTTELFPGLEVKCGFRL